MVELQQLQFQRDPRQGRLAGNVPKRCNSKENTCTAWSAYWQALMRNLLKKAVCSMSDAFWWKTHFGVSIGRPRPGVFAEESWKAGCGTVMPKLILYRSLFGYKFSYFRRTAAAEPWKRLGVQAPAARSASGALVHPSPTAIALCTERLCRGFLFTFSCRF